MTKSAPQLQPQKKRPARRRRRPRHTAAADAAAANNSDHGDDSRKTTKNTAAIAAFAEHQHHDDAANETSLITALRKIDPFIQFLTRATGQPMVPFTMLQRAVPAGLFTTTTTNNNDNNTTSTNMTKSISKKNSEGVAGRSAASNTTDNNNGTPSSMLLLDHYVEELSRRGILHTTSSVIDSSATAAVAARAATTTTTRTTTTTTTTDTTKMVGFPPPLSVASASVPDTPSPPPAKKDELHGNTKTGARRRLAALERILKREAAVAEELAQQRPEQPRVDNAVADGDNDHEAETAVATSKASKRKATAPVNVAVDYLAMISEAREGVRGETDTAGGDDHDCINAHAAAANATDDNADEGKEARAAVRALQERLFGRSSTSGNTYSDADSKGNGNLDNADDDENARLALPRRILPRQIAYAGSHKAQDSIYAALDDDVLAQIPPSLLRAFGFDVLSSPHSSAASTAQQHTTSGRRLLYRHQAAAVTAAIRGQHCTTCTGTGSGKSLCFLLPALTATYNTDATSLLIFPTKALAQDQYSKLMALLGAENTHSGDTEDDDLVLLRERIHPATLDGDCSHANRAHIAKHANIILTNPDTLHAAILPAWKTVYRRLLAQLHYVVIDEAHMYDGVFGAHVSMILCRLARVTAAAAAQQQPEPLPSSSSSITFLAASATLPYPEQHFRQLCPIGPNEQIHVVTHEDDGSPRATKHFMVWNPPILLTKNGRSTGQVSFPKTQQQQQQQQQAARASSVHMASSSTARSGMKRPRNGHHHPSAVSLDGETSLILPPSATTTEEEGALPTVEGSSLSSDQPWDNDTLLEDTALAGRKRQHGGKGHDVPTHSRRHAADETALLLARSVVQGVRCIAFCKTRNLVEWVYERVVTVLKQDPATAHLAERVESYRGGYSKLERRQIEQRLFCNELLGVVGTNALELGVDIGGIDVTLHCGFPTSHASLLQQAGRGGRRGSKLDAPSFSIMVCFNSPGEQYMWRNPSVLLGQGASAQPNTIPVINSIVQGHLLCAAAEFPLAGGQSLQAIVDPTSDGCQNQLLSDHDLFGGREVYEETLASLKSNGSLCRESVTGLSNQETVIAYKARPALQKVSSRVSIRSIEMINYSVVDLGHPGQSGRTCGIYDPRAVLDTLPYSRVFYHAHPGAIITHRGQRYKIVSMTRPPAFVPDNFAYRRTLSLAAFAEKTQANYMTRPLSQHHITVVKQIERVELHPSSADKIPSSPSIGQATATKDGMCTFAGCGSVSVKRTVRGYKKISAITRAEISRSELSLPPLEFETFGLWIDTEPDVLTKVLGEQYGPGVHALSHALLAAAPVFAPGLVVSDLECDHSYDAPTRLTIFDERAGGSGSSQRIWRCIFQPKGLVEAAIELLESCSFCDADASYDGGCPACIHAPNCLQFNMHMSTSAAIFIGKSMLCRIKRTGLYARHLVEKKRSEEDAGGPRGDDKKASTPRRNARQKAVRRAKEMQTASNRQFVVGRPSWPLDGDEANGRQVRGD